MVSTCELLWNDDFILSNFTRFYPICPVDVTNFWVRFPALDKPEFDHVTLYVWARFYNYNDMQGVQHVPKENCDSLCSNEHTWWHFTLTLFAVPKFHFCPCR